jgi:methionine-rich copper-binding protein CopC
MRTRNTTLSAFAALSVAVPLAAFHTHLTRAEPAIDGTVREVPKQIRLWFNERPEVALSGATLMKEDHAPVAVIKMAATDDTLSVAGPVPVALEPGRYMVMWKTGSKDGHVVRGTYYFRYDPAAEASP